MSFSCSGCDICPLKVDNTDKNVDLKFVTEYNEAVKNFLDSTFNLAESYLDLGTDENDLSAKAVELYEKCAIHDHAESQYALGELYTLGVPVKNIQRGVEWLNHSIKNKNNKALHYLGEMYVRGNYVRQNLGKAMELLTSCIEAENDPDSELTKEAKESLEKIPFIYAQELMKELSDTRAKLKQFRQSDKENSKIIAEKDQIIDELMHRPGGPGYLEAQTRFEESAQISL